MVIALPTMGLLFSLLLRPATDANSSSETYISASTSHQETFFLWMLTDPNESFPGEEADDDDDSARELSRTVYSVLFNLLSVNHFFDHPAFNQSFVRVDTPPPRA